MSKKRAPFSPPKETHEQSTPLVAKFGDGCVLINIEGKPIPESRPRAGKNGHFYVDTANHKRDLQERIREGLLLNQLPCPLYEKKVPVKVNVAFTLQQSSGHEPDIDNLLKLVLDVGNGVLYRDDVQVHRCTATKYKKPIQLTSFEWKPGTKIIG